MTTRDLGALRDGLRPLGGPVASLAEALPDAADDAALDALVPGIVRALKIQIYGSVAPGIAVPTEDVRSVRGRDR